ncbi:hypothetical protein CSW98_05025 [Vibrio sp. HA2012]|uniref:efflux RND transporter periplasmic adaptor subunit n=1 Tax=Vibrio sp. HA2012 TaxID=1971595 RepID=UPI000C2C16C2|nr:efflux RND transporter periplasmic adaptor subunit [Vibrio sp. HA2012]PJC87266.1 hypothetical protein CSW98_05025 [Vibrio sp. HA2012]
MKCWIRGFVVCLVSLSVICTLLLAISGKAETLEKHKTLPPAIISVQAIVPDNQLMNQKLSMFGSIVPWKELVVSSQTEGLRLISLTVDVGDSVHKGQLLASFDSSLIVTELARAEADVAYYQALLEEAKINKDRAAKLSAKNAVSEQSYLRYSTEVQTFKAQLDSAQAIALQQHIRLDQTRIYASDDGIVAAKEAVVGEVTDAGHLLYRIIKDNRLQWHARVLAQELKDIKPGQEAILWVRDGEMITGKVSRISPQVSVSSQYGIVYIDIAEPAVLAGMFASGYIRIYQKPALSLPTSALILRDGYSYVAQILDSGKIKLLKVETGIQDGNYIEILSGVSSNNRVVLTGGSFLSDGDYVNIVSVSSEKNVQLQMSTDGVEL